MDIKKIISELIAKFTSDAGLLPKFRKDPLDTVKSLVGGEVSAADLGKIADGVKTGLDAGGLKEAAGGLKDKLGGLLG